MYHHNKHILKFAGWAIVLLLSTNIRAAGLGGIDLDSYLNQPLQARITLIGVPADQVATVSARLASAEDYKILGIDQRHSNVSLYFKPTVWRGKAVIEVTTGGVPVNDPILQFAVDVSWQRGHLLREYTLFLDPPTVPIAAPVREPVKTETSPAPLVKADTPPLEETSVKPATIENEAPTPEVVKPSVEIAEQPEELPEPANTIQVVDSAEGEFGPVAAGDTLWSIANKWRTGKNYSINQTMISIVRLNPSAFVGGDINKMNKGHILRLPSAQDIATIPEQEANRIVNQQLSAWREQTTLTTAAPIVSEQAAGQDEIDSATIAGVTGENANTTESRPSGGRLELIPPAADLLEDDQGSQLEQSDLAAIDSPESTELQMLEQKMAVAEENLFSSREENQQLLQQVQELQKQIDALRSGLNIDDEQLARIQQQMAETIAAEDSRNSIDELVKDQGLSEQGQQVETPTQPEKSLFERWWWLLLVFLLLFVAFAIYRKRSGGQAKTQATDNFLDAVMHKQDQLAGSRPVDSSVSQESLAQDAEDILKVLAQDDASRNESLERQDQQSKDAQSGIRRHTLVDGTEVEELDAEQVRDILDQVEAEKLAQQADADGRSSTSKEQPEEAAGLGAKDEILDTLENDDDSPSDQVDDTEDSIETSLDLARAYMAMDDEEAARVILEGVLVQGSEAQQLEARNMLNKL